VLAEAESLQNSLSMDYGNLEEERVGLRTAVDTLGQEKAEAVAACKAEITTIRTKFKDYHVHHHKKICEFRTNLEKAVNEIGVKCLPYPGKIAPLVK
jgi:hypothetical protein